MIKETLVFLREGIVNFYYTGSIFPTSRWAATALTDAMRLRSKPQNILEVGAGTGAVTMKILQEMAPGDSLTICEVNPIFMEALKTNLEKNEDYLLLKDNIVFFEGLVQDIPEDKTYDIIISALPFLNFEVATVSSIFEKLSRVSNAETTLAYYEYIGIRRLSKIVPLPRRRQRMLELDRFFGEQKFAKPVGRDQVWYNILPINIYRMNMVEQTSEAA